VQHQIDAREEFHHWFLWNDEFMISADVLGWAGVAMQEFIVGHIGDLAALMLDFEGDGGSGVMGEFTGDFDVADGNGLVVEEAEVEFGAQVFTLDGEVIDLTGR
jgi:hypothetical protein